MAHFSSLALSPPLISIAVAGHANTGKTSLLRTLAQDVAFGEVRDEAGTTRHVEGIRLCSESGICIDFFDTPGLEDAQALHAFIARQTEGYGSHDRPQRLWAFLKTPEAQARFEQEAKVLRQVLQSDAVLYVVDARDPVLPKHLDELALLADAGKPVLPVFNFTQAQTARVGFWREQLAKLGLHLAVAFDTVALTDNAQAHLFDLLGKLLHIHADALSRFWQDRAHSRKERKEEACRQLAVALVRLAALALKTAQDEPAQAIGQALLQERVREEEHQLLQRLLALYRFRPEDAALMGLAGFDGRFRQDLFDPQILRQMGQEVGSAAAKGAAVGASIDLLVAGLSLGTGAAIGALAAGAWHSANRYGQTISGKWRGFVFLRVPDAVLTILAHRFVRLLYALEQRGHAATFPTLVDEGGFSTPLWPVNTLPKPLKKARFHPDWFEEENPGATYARTCTAVQAFLCDASTSKPKS
jgi:hypothetical protein